MTEARTSLFQAILQLKSSEECDNFFRDLCTPTEIRALKERWRVAQLLNQGELSYREIHHKTGISLATIGRVARFLTQESNGGYKLILDRLAQQGKNHADV